MSRLAVVLILIALAFSAVAGAHSLTFDKSRSCRGWVKNGHLHNDLMIGSSICYNTPDYFSGLGGNDRLWGNHGGDLLYGGPGYDLLQGGPGADQLNGGTYRDFLYGGPGRDILSGGSGNDSLNGGFGYDFCWGGLGVDTFIDCEAISQ